MNYIRLRKNNLCVENLSAHKLAKKYKTPFYCYSLAQLKNNYNAVNSAFKTVKPIICFSVKSNSNLTLPKKGVKAWRLSSQEQAIGLQSNALIHRIGS